MATEPNPRFPIGEKKVVNIEVLGCESVTGSKSGDPEWKLRVKLPWDGNYTSNLYIPRTKPEGPPPGHYVCEVERTGLKSTMDGKPKKGDYGDHYFYKCLSFGLDPEAAARPADEAPPAATDAHEELFPDDPKPSPTPLIVPAPMAPDHPSKRRSIERQTCLDMALTAHMYRAEGEALSMSHILATADSFYAWVSQAPEADQPVNPEDLPW